MKKYYVSTIVPFRNIEVSQRDFNAFIDHVSRHYTIVKDQDVINEGCKDMEVAIAYYGHENESKHPSTTLLGIVVYSGIEDGVPFL